jgi:nucleoside-diphosphate-sugar epimerase
MQVLVTGGAGVIGRPLIAELLERGHRVRLFTRHARTQVAEWPDGVEAWEGDIADKSAVTNSVNGCQVIIHIAGIARERPPDATFERINVLGTQLLLEEASATGRPRFIFISSLGADTGKSEYHASKRAAEGMVMKYGGDWRIVRPGNVYGPGDEVISSLMTMVRTFPFVPVVDDGEQQFQPVWSNDLAIALANLVERDDLRDTVMDVAGLEVITTRSLLERMMKITGREVGILPVPGALADLGTRFASMFGAELPASPDTLTMLGERNVVKPPEKNRLPELLGRGPSQPGSVAAGARSGTRSWCRAAQAALARHRRRERVGRTAPGESAQELR